jgi:hypothetical protein
MDPVTEFGNQIIELLGASSRCGDSVVALEGRPDEGAPESSGGTSDEPCFRHALSETWLRK